MASLTDQKREAVRALFLEAGVQYGERWRTEAEDGIVSAVLSLTYEMSTRQVKLLGELLKCHRQHIKGESRPNLMALLDDSVVEEANGYLENKEPAF